jgi:hypothetical protein
MSPRISFPVLPIKSALGIAAAMVTFGACGADSSKVVEPPPPPPGDPQVLAINPTTVPAGLPSLILDVTGANFDAGAVVKFAGLPFATHELSSTRLQITLSAAQLQDPGNRDVQVQNGTGVVSNIVPFVLSNTTPQVASFQTIQTGSDVQSVTLQVFGTNFLHSSVVSFNGAPLATAKMSDNELDATLPASDFAAAGVYQITVENPLATAHVSNSLPFEIKSEPLTLSGLDSYGATAGSSGYPLSVYGTGFTPLSVARWSGNARPTRWVNAHRLDVYIASADVASFGTAPITVLNLGASGGTSGSKDVVVRPVPGASVTSVVKVDVPATFLLYDQFSDRFYASVPDTAPAYASTVIAIDPAGGAVIGSVALGKNPGVMGVSPEGGTLWVGVDSAGQLRRVDIASLTPSTTISFGGMVAREIKVRPGQPGAIAVERRILPTTGSSGTVMFVDGNRLPVAPDPYHANTTFVFNETGTFLYGFNGFSSEFGFHTLEVHPDGLLEVNSTSGLIGSYNVHFDYAAGRVYTSDGNVIDAERRIRLGKFDIGLPVYERGVYADPQLGRIFWLTSNILKVFDMNTLSLLASITLPITVYQEHPSVDMMRLVKWGTDGLAFRDGKEIYILRTQLAAP